MFIFLMVLQGIIALALIGVVLLQKSDGSGLSGLGGTGSPSGFLSARGTANLLTRATGILAAAFMLICLLLAALAGRDSETKSIVEDIVVETSTVETIPTNSSTDMPSAPAADNGTPEVPTT